MRAWVLNLDADLELARPTGYAPRAAVRARTAQMAERIEGLVPSGDLIIGEGVQARDCAGYAWCPTPRALELLDGAGARLPEVPRFDVVRRVNHRRFNAELGQTLPGAAFVRDRGEIEQLLARASDTGFWLLKRPHGFAGAARRRVAVGALGGDDARWVDASLRVDGLQMEPWVERIADFSCHGFVAADGAVALGEVCLQQCSPRGEWQNTERAPKDELAGAERQLLRSEAERCARALHQAGYFGPFGIDAYRYRGGGGAQLNPRSELNARYTMGWAIGMGDERPDLG